jgi:hypothetical protein
MTPDAGTSSDAGTTVGVGPGGFQLDGGAGSGGSNVEVDPSGHLTLGIANAELPFAWLANNDESTVSKFDTRTGQEVARYFAVIPVDGRPNPSGGVGNPNGLRGNAANNPSRTAVDLFGDVWIANRAVNTQGSVTKIASTLAGCRERNGVPGIQTSRDLNGDGKISTNPADGELITPTDWADAAQYDECILHSTPLGGATASAVKARALAISRGAQGTAGDIWVGLHDTNTLVKLDPVTGQQVPASSSSQSITLSFGPYGAAVDSQQRLWVVASTLSPARLALIDTRTGTLVRDNITAPAPSAAYGIAVDSQDRVWLAGWTADVKAFRYSHPPGVGTALGTWTAFDFTNAVSQVNTRMRRPRGIATDAQGFVWMTSDLNDANALVSQLIAFSAETGAIKRFNVPGGGAVDFIDATSLQPMTREAVGVALDTNNHPWVNNRSGNVMRVHRDTGEVLRTAQQAAGLYTYSDFTGYQLRNFTAPRGRYFQQLSGCGPGTQWRQLRWDASLPTGTGLETYVTVASQVGDLGDPALRRGPFTSQPVNLTAAGVPSGQYMRVEFILSSMTQKASPALRSFEVNYLCP